MIRRAGRNARAIASVHIHKRPFREPTGLDGGGLIDARGAEAFTGSQFKNKNSMPPQTQTPSTDSSAIPQISIPAVYKARTMSWIAHWIKVVMT
jgi:hypothetical protein